MSQNLPNVSRIAPKIIILAQIATSTLKRDHKTSIPLSYYFSSLENSSAAALDTSLENISPIRENVSKSVYV